MTKLTPEELASISKIHNEYENLAVLLGRNSIQKQQLLSQFKDIEKRETEIGLMLVTKYGKGNINFETGEFTPE